MTTYSLGAVGLALIALSALSWLGTGRYISYAEKAQIIDKPNERSCHIVPTPRGGGLVFVVLFLAVIAVFFFRFPQERRLWFSLLGGGSAVALIGWIDDRRGLSAKVRLLVHLGAVLFALICLGGLPNLSLGKWNLHLGLWGYPLALLGGVWSINLYNFMDGIDGIAASECIFVALAGGLFLLFAGSIPLALAVFTLAACALGFIPWNWQPAKVFMGDVASGFLGFVFAVFAIASEGKGTVPLVVWAMLLSVFVADATFTILRRIRNGERLSDAHRTHAFQVAVQKGCSHKKVVLAMLCINLIALVLAMFGQLNPYLQPIIALVLLFGLFIVWKSVIGKGGDNRIPNHQKAKRQRA